MQTNTYHFHNVNKWKQDPCNNIFPFLILNQKILFPTHPLCNFYRNEAAHVPEIKHTEVSVWITPKIIFAVKAYQG